MEYYISIFFLILTFAILYADDFVFVRFWKDQFHQWRVYRYFTHIHPNRHRLNLRRENGERKRSSQPLSIPKIGEILVRDERNHASDVDHPRQESDIFRIVTWNIEFGYKTQVFIRTVNLMFEIFVKLFYVLAYVYRR